ncbi:hypothetical protein DAI22_01g253000 [Oryza sativa Japonica Group]|nr:hypothetical protein DAI22_01g253000 [Oryza sativa Japonica Group]
MLRRDSRDGHRRCGGSGAGAGGSPPHRENPSAPASSPQRSARSHRRDAEPDGDGPVVASSVAPISSPAAPLPGSGPRWRRSRIGLYIRRPILHGMPCTTISSSASPSRRHARCH